MIVGITIPKLVHFDYVLVEAGVRYWEDARVNGTEDINGDLIPCRKYDYWCPKINIDTGQIEDWPKGKTADIYYKVCDDGAYEFMSREGLSIIIEGYVPSFLSIDGDGYGDYISITVDENGFIKNWNPTDVAKYLTEYHQEGTIHYE